MTPLSEAQASKLYELFVRCFQEGYTCGIAHQCIGGGLDDAVKDAWRRSDIAGALAGFV